MSAILQCFIIGQLTYSFSSWNLKARKTLSIFNNWGLEINSRKIFFPIIIASFVKATVIIFSLLGVSWRIAFHFSGAASICGQLELLQQGDSLSHKHAEQTRKKWSSFPSIPHGMLFRAPSQYKAKHGLYVYNPKATCPLLEVVNLVIPFPHQWALNEFVQWILPLDLHNRQWNLPRSTCQFSTGNKKC